MLNFDPLWGAPPTVGGLPVSVSVHTHIEVPVKKHEKRPWMTGRAYHRRVQKKWIKRHGTMLSDHAFIAGRTLVVSPAVFEKLKERAEGLTDART